MDPGRQIRSVRNTLCLSVRLYECLISDFQVNGSGCGFAQLSFAVLIVTAEIGINLSFMWYVFETIFLSNAPICARQWTMSFDIWLETVGV